MFHSYTEDQLCEQPAIDLFKSLGWDALCATDEVFGAVPPPLPLGPRLAEANNQDGQQTCGGLGKPLGRGEGGAAIPLPLPMGEGRGEGGVAIGREASAEAVLVPRLRAALEKLNPKLAAEALSLAVDELTRDRSTMSLAAANREVYALLKEGVRISVPDRERGGQRIVQVRLVDWENPQTNDFLLVSQMSITGDLYTCRPDLIGFVNGLPLIVIELKKPGVSARVAFDENLTHYKAQIPQLFWFNAFMIASNGTESTVGSLTANWERFFEWKRIEREDEPRRVSLEVMIRGTCEPTRLLDLIENFVLFSEEKAGLIKIVGQNHQFLGVNNALAAMLKARAEGHGRAGVFWQTQGSGKSYSMVFYAQKVLRKLEGNWTFVVVTDRTELDDQIARTFKACGAVSATDADQCHASSCAHLRELLRGNHRYVFTLIHKFRPETSHVRAETPSSPALLPKVEGSPEFHPEDIPSTSGTTIRESEQQKGGTESWRAWEAIGIKGEGSAAQSGQYRGGLHFAGLVNRARELRDKQTSAEEIAWELLRDRRFENLKFRRQHQIGNYVADFFCHEHQLDIELDGDVHKSPDVAEKDKRRDKTLTSLGFKVLRFPNDLILNQPEDFLAAILDTLRLPSTSGTTIRESEQQKGGTKSWRAWEATGTEGEGGERAMPPSTFGRGTEGEGGERAMLPSTFGTFGRGTEGEGGERAMLPSTFGRGTEGEGDNDVMPVLCDRHDIIVLVDEAHRSQYDTLALNMRAALPNALFVAFTGTPLMAGEERTRDVFGDYVSIYDFQQSVEDGATVPLYYENRTPELRLENPKLNDEIYDLIEAAELDEDQEKKLERELGRQYHIITRDDRLDTVAKDIVRHFLGRGFQGKAMVISIDKATALKMHDKVRKYWEIERTRVENELAGFKKFPKPGQTAPLENEEKFAELERRLSVLKTTGMAVIVSPGQNEIEQMKKLGLDIAPHRERMNKEDLDENFKDPNHPLRLVFVCAMWLTGFDAPSCSTVYLDKPMRNHTLMQTIARANRVFPGKHSGMIVDYCNVFASLEKALAIYGKGSGGGTPVRDKKELVEELRQAMKNAMAFCAGHRASLDLIEKASGMERIARLADAVDALISPDTVRKEFFAHERYVTALYNAIKPDLDALEFASGASCLATIANMIRLKIGGGKPPDITGIMAAINQVLDDSITSEGFVIQETHDGKPLPLLDLSKIDFAALAKKFEKSKRKKTELEQLRAAITAQLEKLIRLNKTRADYAEKFEELIDSYNNGSRNIEELFRELLNLSRSLSEEQERHLRENLSEEELTVFDILTRPGPDLSPAEREEVKKVARLLLERIKALLVLNWRQRSQSRAQVRLTIEDLLDDGLPRSYSPDLFTRKCSDLFEHLYESYPGEGASIYSAA